MSKMQYLNKETVHFRGNEVSRAQQRNTFMRPLNYVQLWDLKIWGSSA